MKISLNYVHDSNAPLIEKIIDTLSKDADGNLKHEVGINTSEIKAGKDWHGKITKGLKYPINNRTRYKIVNAIWQTK